MTPTPSPSRAPQALAVGEIVGTEKRGFALMTLVRWEAGFDRNKIGTLLYAHPLTAQVAERQPLTDEQIVDARDAVLPSQGESFDCIAFARAIERAHGIPASGEAKSHE